MRVSRDVRLPLDNDVSRLKTSLYDAIRDHSKAINKAADKLREFVSVKDYGAVLDGVSDDTVAVQNALNVGGRIEIPGMALVSATLKVKADTHLIGVNGGGVTLAAGANTHIFENENYGTGTDTGIVFDGLTIDGNAANQAVDGTYTKHCIRLDGATGAVIKNCTIRNAGTDCVNLIECQDAVVRHSTLHGAYNHAITFQECHGFSAEGNTIHSCGSKTDALGFTSSGHAVIGTNVASNNVRIVGNLVYDMGDSCLRNERAGQGWVVADNVVVNGGKDSIKVMGVVGNPTKPKANVITGNVIIDAGNTGIVANGDGTIVANNMIYGTGKNTAGAAAGKWFASAAGISVLDDSSDVVIHGNYVREAYANGILVEGGARAIVDSNAVTDCGTNGIELSGHDGATVENNRCWNNSAASSGVSSGIRIQGTGTSYARQSVRYNRCYNTGATGQLYGLRLEGGSDVSESLAQFNQLWGNTNAAQAFVDWSGTGVVVNQNTGYKTENRGTAVIANGTTTVAVTHGCVTTPDSSKVSITPVSGLGNATKFWGGTPNSTQFNLSVNVDPGVDVTFAWQILP